MSLLLLLLMGCASQVEDFPRSSTPLGVGTQSVPPAGGEDTSESDTGQPPSGDDTAAR